MDIEVILDAAQSEVSGLRDLAQRFLDAAAPHLGVPFDMASVLARRAKEPSANNPSIHKQSALLRQLGAYGLFRGAH